MNAFALDASLLLGDTESTSEKVRSFVSTYEMSTVVVATKGESTTSHHRPVQLHYRDPEQWAAY
jgi:hypothetical protein